MISLRKPRELSIFFLFLLASALLLAVLSTSSPLYPTNPWVDANCYMTVARGMRAGLLPYRDLIEQKGPLLYGLHWVAVLISPNSFLGVYLLETLSFALFLTAAWKTVCLYEKRSWAAALLLIGVAALLMSSCAFEYGDSAEELCAPLLAWSMYDALRCIRRKERMTARCLLRNGILAGCVLWIKYSLLGLHFAWMAVFAIDSVIREKRLWPAVKMCLIFLSGMALTAIVWLCYFGANGALGDLFGVYFVQNITEYKTSASLAATLIKGLGGAMLQNPLMFLLAAAGFVWALRDGGVRERICMAAMFVCMSLMVYFGGRLYRYTCYAFAVFAPMGVVPLLRLLEKLRRRLAVGVLTAGMLVVALISCSMLPEIGGDREELVQMRFAREIGRTENATLLNYGFLDGGFYLAADVQPSEAWFVRLNTSKEKAMAAQTQAVESGNVDYVVTKEKKLGDYEIDAGLYELVCEGSDEYSMRQDRATYYLYRRKDLSQG